MADSTQPSTTTRPSFLETTKASMCGKLQISALNRGLTIVIEGEIHHSRHRITGSFTNSSFNGPEFKTFYFWLKSRSTDFTYLNPFTRHGEYYSAHEKQLCNVLSGLSQFWAWETTNLYQKACVANYGQEVERCGSFRELQGKMN